MKTSARTQRPAPGLRVLIASLLGLSLLFGSASVASAATGITAKPPREVGRMEAGEHRYVQGRWLVLGAVQDSKGNNEVVITSWADVEFDFWGWRYVANTRKNYNWLREGKMQKTGRGCYGGRDGKYRTEATLRIENKESYEVSLNLDGKGGIDLKIPGNHVREIKARSGARTRSCWGS